MLSVIPHLEPCCNSMLSDVMTILNDNPGCGNGDIKAEIEEEEKTIIDLLRKEEILAKSELMRKPMQLRLDFHSKAVQYAGGAGLYKVQHCPMSTL